MDAINEIIFDFGAFKLRGALMAPPRRGVGSGEIGTSSKLYYFQIQVLSTINIKKSGESALKKLLEGKQVSFTYEEKEHTGIVTEVKVVQILDTWHIGLKVKLTDMKDEITPPVSGSGELP